MSNAEPVEPPAHDERWDGAIATVDGDFERDVWLALARDVYGLDPEVLAERSTGQIAVALVGALVAYLALYTLVAAHNWWVQA